jgi:hypothetical protein
MNYTLAKQVPASGQLRLHNLSKRYLFQMSKYMLCNLIKDYVMIKKIIVTK